MGYQLPGQADGRRLAVRYLHRHLGDEHPDRELRLAGREEVALPRDGTGRPAAYPQFAAYLVIELERPAGGHVQVRGGRAASAGEHRGGRQADLGEITREQPLGPAQWLTW